MTRKSTGFLEKTARVLDRPVPQLNKQDLTQFVRSFLDRGEDFLSALSRGESPLYLIDTETLKKRAVKFRNAFSDELPDIRIYYALKSNSHPVIVSTLIKKQFGIDVSSGLELQTAIECDVNDIIFSGPGKQLSELKLAVENSSRVTVLLDSFGELAKLEQISSQKQTPIKAGVRLTTDETGIWKKFGIPLNQLSRFFDETQRCRYVDLRGLQFHISWNLNPDKQIDFITRLGKQLHQLEKRHRAKINFIDIGGGFWPEAGEWMQRAATPEGIIETALGSGNICGSEHYKQTACNISEFAEQISRALKRYLPDDINSTICLEPGRWLCNDAMHILLTVADVKSPDLVITDGGTNAVGWERFETDYFPVINLTNPSLDEHECLIAGSLCTPHDIWGYSYFGEKIKEGDILLVPNQGAYTYSLRQQFIKPLPECLEIKKGITNKSMQL